MRKPHTVLDISPEVVNDEIGPYDVPAGQTKYTLVLSDAQVELLAQGVVPEAVSQRAFILLGWKRENARVASRELATGKEA